MRYFDTGVLLKLYMALEFGGPSFAASTCGSHAWPQPQG